MKYNDECIEMKLPQGFSFHSRPNFCTWDFKRNECLITVTVHNIDKVPNLAGYVQGTKALNNPDYEILGPNKLLLKSCQAIYGGCIKRINNKFYNEQVQVSMPYEDHSLFVIISDRSPFDISDFIPFLDSIKVSKREVDAARNNYVPKRKVSPQKRKREATGPEHVIKLPLRLSYLQPVIAELSTVLSRNDEVDKSELIFSILVDVLRHRLEGLPFEKAEKRIETDHKDLESWLKTHHLKEHPACSLLLFLNSHSVQEIMEGH